MKVKFTSSQAVELHRYLKAQLAQWPQREQWTPEQSAVCGAFIQIECALQRMQLVQGDDRGR